MCDSAFVQSNYWKRKFGWQLVYTQQSFPRAKLDSISPVLNSCLHCYQWTNETAGLENTPLAVIRRCYINSRVQNALEKIPMNKNVLWNYWWSNVTEYLFTLMVFIYIQRTLFELINISNQPIKTLQQYEVYTQTHNFPWKIIPLCIVKYVV